MRGPVAGAVGSIWAIAGSFLRADTHRVGER